ncbi:sugar ABC transporter ATP-binding protein [Acidisoma cellulosilytica]|uniref:Sugar ABC transporter ATP-binding protein n=1 Tax=Acidisoma cellulosilyticum TaxID=2802395 RepID=A0A963Z4C4_9PROT|nr:sugar ABC transporter ATP-binding protein [Acidisoma cellulosilyticum]MCB8881513.1 sugar ABC transporter ATP-binding protein [Acidisoma cellulosilyticum]
MQLLETRGVGKIFGRVTALEQMDLVLNQGEVLGLVGQNGSGKSTLLKIIGGLVQPSSGEMLLHGKPVRLRSQSDATMHGIGMVHQEQSLVPNLTVAENIFLDKPNPAKAQGLYRWKQLYEAAAAQLRKIEVDIDPRAIVEDLRFAQRQQVELAKVLAVEDLVSHPPIILFDEPTSVLTPEEIRLLFRQIDRLRQSAAIVFVSHRLDEILHISDRAVVMTDGRKVADEPVSALNRESLYRLMVGRQRAIRAPRGIQSDEADPSKARLQVSGLSAGQQVRPATLSVAPGEILGLLGVQSSGAEEFCRALFGAEDNVQGKIKLNGAQISVPSPAAAVQAGIGYLPANRHVEGMLKGRTLVENMALTFGLDYGHRGILVNRRAERQVATEWIGRLKVKTRSADARIDDLSGGNQQKVVLGKWLLSRRLQLLLLDHPTRGLDPGARDDLFAVIRAEAAKGLSVIFIADTIGEVLDLSDRVIVMRDGTMSAEYNLNRGDAPSEEDLVRAMV